MIKGDLLSVNVNGLRFYQVLPVFCEDSRSWRYVVSDPNGIYENPGINGRVREVILSGEKTSPETLITSAPIGRLPEVEELMAPQIAEIIRRKPESALMNGILIESGDLHGVNIDRRRSFDKVVEKMVFSICRYHNIPNMPKPNVIIPRYPIRWTSEIMSKF